MRIRNLEKADLLPMHQSMRKSSDYDSWEHYEGRYGWRSAMRLVDSYVGKPFDIAYSSIIHKLKSKHLSRECYYGYLDLIRYYLYGKGYYPKFYIDDNGVIQRVVYRHNSKDIDLSTVSNKYYVLKSPATKEEAEMHSKFSKAIGYDRYHSLAVGCVTEEEYKKLEKMFYNGVTPIYDMYNYYGTTWFKDLWTRYAITSEKVLKYRTPEYYKYQAELRDHKKKNVRDYYKQKEEQIEEMMNKANLYKKQLELENEYNILRHGFDPKTSFRK